MGNSNSTNIEQELIDSGELTNDQIEAIINCENQNGIGEVGLVTVDEIENKVEVDNNNIDKSINNVIEEYIQDRNIQTFDLNKIRDRFNMLIVGDDNDKLTTFIKQFLDQKSDTYDVIYIFTNSTKKYKDYNEKSDSYSIECGIKIINHENEYNGSYMTVNRKLVRNSRSDKKLFIFDNVNIRGGDGFLLNQIVNGVFHNTSVIISCNYQQHLPKIVLGNMDYNFVDIGNNVLENFMNFSGDKKLFDILQDKTKFTVSQLLEKFINNLLVFNCNATNCENMFYIYPILK